jgi:heme exporter protein D
MTRRVDDPDSQHATVGGGGEPDAATRARRLVLATTGSVGLFTVIGAMVGLLVASRHHRPGHHPSVAGAVIAVAVVLVMLAVMSAVLLWVFNRPSYRTLFAFSWRRRARVAKALRTGRPISDDDVPVAAAIIGATRGQQWRHWIFPVLSVSWLLNAANHHGVLRWLYLALVALAILAVWPLSVRQNRQMLGRTREVTDRQRQATATNGEDAATPSG